MTARPHFRKYHGLGNDYIVIDPADFPFEPTETAIRAVCDRHRGAGSDGILLGPLADFRSPETSTPTLRIFNPDGSEAEKSGNGLRIFSWFLYERGLSGGPQFRLVTKGGPVTATIVDAKSRLVMIDMGKPSFSATSVPVVGLGDEVVDHPADFGGNRCRITCLSMGNPHCVVLGLGASEAVAHTVGPLIETSTLFPHRTNVQFLEALGNADIRISIWERGAGFTLASGSSSCAAAAAARRLGLVGNDVTVHMPGGNLSIRFTESTVYMTGPVEQCIEGWFSDDLMARMYPR